MCTENPNPLDKYQNFHSALPRIVVISALIKVITYIWAYFPIWPLNKLGIARPFEAEEIRRLLFIFYMCVFGGAFITYFSSRWKAEDSKSGMLQKILRFFQVRTLRRLLLETSEQWQDLKDKKEDKDLIDSHHRKSQSSMTALADMTWVVVNDPIPAASAILGTGLSRDSEVLTQGEESRGWVWPAFEERSFEAFRAYYEYVPKGKWTVEYTIRLNNEGEFGLPPTRVEALYSPEMLGEMPNKEIRVEQ